MNLCLQSLCSGRGFGLLLLHEFWLDFCPALRNAIYFLVRLFVWLRASGGNRGCKKCLGLQIFLKGLIVFRKRIQFARKFFVLWLIPKCNQQVIIDSLLFLKINWSAMEAFAFMWMVPHGTNEVTRLWNPRVLAIEMRSLGRGFLFCFACYWNKFLCRYLDLVSCSCIFWCEN